MRALPLLLALVSALALAPALLRALERGGRAKRNYRGSELACPFGLLAAPAAALAALVLAPPAIIAGLAVFPPGQAPLALYAGGVIGLGLLDDAFGPRWGAAGARGAPRGLRAHAAALLRHEPSTGALKAAGSLALALCALACLGLAGERLLLASAVLVLCTHAFNLIDLRPGRAPKAFLLLTGALAVGSRELRPLWALGLFAAPALVAGAYDLRERALLGDAGASLLGALAGLWLVLTLPVAGQLAALALLSAVALYGELRSISALIERTPGLRELDCWGRP